MEKKTQDNLSDKYVDSIELRQIDKFVCDEMSRQIHRYIKAMSGSKTMMEKFEANLSTLTIPQKEEAIARYIDLNRKVLSGLDWQIVVARAMANYCDTFSYLLTLMHDERKMAFYLERVKSKYIRYHEVIEEQGKFGLKNYQGEIMVHPIYDFVRTCYVYVDDLMTMPVIVQKGGKMGLILPDGKDTIVAPFEYDDISLRDEYPYFEAIRGNEKGYIYCDGKFVAISLNK